MIVAELIEALKALPPDLRVGYSGDIGWFETTGPRIGTLKHFGYHEWFEEGEGSGEQVVEV